MPGRKPIIAVTSGVVQKPFSWNWLSWHCIRLLVFLEGGVARRICPKAAPGDYDGLLISGGADISPHLYGQANTHSYNCDLERDEFELGLLRHAPEHNIPVLGICRGAQLINIGRGGTMYQEASDVFRYYVPSRGVFGKLFRRKPSYVFGSRWLQRVFAEGEKQYISSLHHQAIDQLGTNLIRIATDLHGMTQAIEDTGETFVIGVQWHPEFQLLSRQQRSIFRIFINECKKRVYV